MLNCPACTYINTVRAVECEICGTYLKENSFESKSKSTSIEKVRYTCSDDDSDKEYQYYEMAAESCFDEYVDQRTSEISRLMCKIDGKILSSRKLMLTHLIKEHRSDIISKFNCKQRNVIGEVEVPVSDSFLQSDYELSLQLALQDFDNVTKTDETSPKHVFSSSNSSVKAIKSSAKNPLLQSSRSKSKSILASLNYFENKKNSHNEQSNTDKLAKKRVKSRSSDISTEIPKPNSAYKKPVHNITMDIRRVDGDNMDEEADEADETNHKWKEIRLQRLIAKTDSIATKLTMMLKDITTTNSSTTPQDQLYVFPIHTFNFHL